MSNWYICLLVLTIFVIVECGFFKKNEKIVPVIDHFNICGKDEDNRLKINLNTHKYNRTHTGVNMNITLYDSFDQRYMLHVELRIWGDGGWKRNFFNYKRDDACNTLYLLLGQPWNEIIDAAGVKRGCPIKPGFYHFENYFINIARVPFLTSTGRFLFIAKIKKENIPQLCIELEFSIQTELVH